MFLMGGGVIPQAHYAASIISCVTLEGPVALSFFIWEMALLIIFSVMSIGGL